ncbi:MaoC family dehydratase [Limibacillus sp. MBR-115]|jgi:3-hydroxybutyryl-CoA dehydratase|uniref:MaoC family dehydratase n=1 Tax=Limibacillus sp. MBR-115 TaxID=3156465 RepID=UPI003398E8C9
MQELHGYYIEDLEPGMSAIYAKTVTEADIVMFAGLSGDTNPVHLNQTFAEGTMFKERIAHGMLSASFISTVLGTRLPGPGCIYLSQTLNFKAPVRIGDTVVARVTVREVNREKKRLVVDTVCTVGDTQVLDGEAKLMVASRAKLAPGNEAAAVVAAE